MKALLSILALLCVACDQASHAGGSPAPLPASVEGSGVVRGSIRFAGAAPVMKAITATESCCRGEPQLMEETVLVNPNGTLRNVFVYLEGAPRTDGSLQPPALLDQVRCRYTPHAMGIQAGQTLRIRSSDPTMHNVHFNPSLNRPRNLAMTLAGEEIPTKFDHAEFVRMKCDVHPWMTAWVGVFDHPFFAVTADEGGFAIKGIPAGTFKLVAWHELYGRLEQTLTIADDKPVETNFVFGRSSKE